MIILERRKTITFQVIILDHVGDISHPYNKISILNTVGGTL